jgi:hypothetical protein
MPLRLLSTVSLAAAAAAVYWIVRTRVAGAIGLVAATTVLWYPSLRLAPWTLGVTLALAAVVFGAWALDREGVPFDIVIAAALSLALLTSGVGVAGAAAYLTYYAFTRPPLVRWLVVAVPSAMWVLWYIVVSNTHRTAGRNPWELVQFAWGGILESFEGLGLGYRFLGIVLMLAFAAVFIWRLRTGLLAAVNAVSWTVALIVWWLWIGYIRSGNHGYPNQLVGSAFIILAVLPTTAFPDRVREVLESIPVALAAFALCGLVVIANHNEILDRADTLADQGRIITQQFVAANLKAANVPDNAVLNTFGGGSPTAETYRDLTTVHGVPGASKTIEPDRRIIDLGSVETVGVGKPPKARCVALGRMPLLPPDSTTVLRAGQKPVDVQLRRFGSAWVSIGTIRPQGAARVTVPGLQSATPWQVRAQGGACRVRTAPATKVVVPKANATLSGVTTLAARAGNVYITKVEFHLRSGFNDVPLGPAIPGFGWNLQWNSATVPNGRYTLVAIAFDSANNQDVSDPVPVTVQN